VAVKMPAKYGFAEDAVRQAVKASAGRGKVDVNISLVSTAEEDTGVILGEAAAKQYIDSLLVLQEKYNVGGEITVGLLAGLPDVLKQGHSELDAEAISRVILGAVTAALEGFGAMREKEGASLAQSIAGKLDAVEALCAEIEKRAPEVQALYADKLRERIANLANLPGDDAVLQQRIAVEIAAFADKASIDEELVRLASHVAQFRGILAARGEGAIGKKMDFIVQEMNREANTVGSKANDLRITDRMIELKNEIENIREQVQNIC
jgi:uncharacterized protein (TIGR00255 family)